MNEKIKHLQVEKLKHLQDTRFEQALINLNKKRKSERDAEIAMNEAQTALDERKIEEKNNIDGLYKAIENKHISRKDIHKMNEKIKYIKHETIQFETDLADKKVLLEKAQLEVEAAKQLFAERRKKVEKYDHLLENEPAPTQPVST